MSADWRRLGPRLLGCRHRGRGGGGGGGAESANWPPAWRKECARIAGARIWTTCGARWVLLKSSTTSKSGAKTRPDDIAHSCRRRRRAPERATKQWRRKWPARVLFRWVGARRGARSARRCSAGGRRRDCERASERATGALEQPKGRRTIADWGPQVADRAPNPRRSSKGAD